MSLPDSIVASPSVARALTALTDAHPQPDLPTGIRIIASAQCPPDTAYLIKDTTWEDFQKQLDEAVLRLAEQGLL